MREGIGVAAAILSSGLGGTAIGATRYLAGAVDPLTIGLARFGIGLLVLVPIAALSGQPWPRAGDRRRVAALGVLFFGIFPWLFNAALAATTAARGALALSTLPLLTMAAAAVLRVEALTPRKAAGVAVAVAGVALALASGLSEAPPGAWRGDLLMVAAALCMAFYNVWSRPLIARSGVLPYTAAGMAAGTAFLAATVAVAGGGTDLATLAPAGWAALAYLGIVCGAAIFWLWAAALARTTPTRVAVSVTVNPVTASLVGLVLLGEPIGGALLAGMAAVAAGIALAVR
jgi:drug/metabolite transporter (DMT)-like permease